MSPISVDEFLEHVEQKEWSCSGPESIGIISGLLERWSKGDETVEVDLCRINTMLTKRLGVWSLAAAFRASMCLIERKSNLSAVALACAMNDNNAISSKGTRLDNVDKKVHAAEIAFLVYKKQLPQFQLEFEIPDFDVNDPDAWGNAYLLAKERFLLRAGIEFSGFGDWFVAALNNPTMIVKCYHLDQWPDDVYDDAIRVIGLFLERIRKEVNPSWDEILGSLICLPFFRFTLLDHMNCGNLDEEPVLTLIPKFQSYGNRVIFVMNWTGRAYASALAAFSMFQTPGEITGATGSSFNKMKYALSSDVERVIRTFERETTSEERCFLVPSPMIDAKATFNDCTTVEQLSAATHPGVVPTRVSKSGFGREYLARIHELIPDLRPLIEEKIKTDEKLRNSFEVLKSRTSILKNGYHSCVISLSMDGSSFSDWSDKDCVDVLSLVPNEFATLAQNAMNAVKFNRWFMSKSMKQGMDRVISKLKRDPAGLCQIARIQALFEETKIVMNGKETEVLEYLLGRGVSQQGQGAAFFSMMRGWAEYGMPFYGLDNSDDSAVVLIVVGTTQQLCALNALSLLSVLGGARMGTSYFSNADKNGAAVGQHPHYEIIKVVTMGSKNSNMAGLNGTLDALGADPAFRGPGTLNNLVELLRRRMSSNNASYSDTQRAVVILQKVLNLRRTQHHADLEHTTDLLAPLSSAFFGKRLYDGTTQDAVVERDLQLKDFDHLLQHLANYLTEKQMSTVIDMRQTLKDNPNTFFFGNCAKVFKGQTSPVKDYGGPASALVRRTENELTKTPAYGGKSAGFIVGKTLVTYAVDQTDKLVVLGTNVPFVKTNSVQQELTNKVGSAGNFEEVAPFYVEVINNNYVAYTTNVRKVLTELDGWPCIVIAGSKWSRVRRDASTEILFKGTEAVCKTTSESLVYTDDGNLAQITEFLQFEGKVPPVNVSRGVIDDGFGQHSLYSVGSTLFMSLLIYYGLIPTAYRGNRVAITQLGVLPDPAKGGEDLAVFLFSLHGSWSDQQGLTIHNMTLSEMRISEDDVASPIPNQEIEDTVSQLSGCDVNVTKTFFGNTSFLRFLRACSNSFSELQVNCGAMIGVIDLIRHKISEEKIVPTVVAGPNGIAFDCSTGNWVNSLDRLGSNCFLGSENATVMKYSDVTIQRLRDQRGILSSLLKCDTSIASLGD